MRKDREFELESIVSNFALQYYDDLPALVHEVMRYLYGVTSDPAFDYSEYYDWLTAKAEFELTCGLSAAE